MSKMKSFRLPDEIVINLEYISEQTHRPATYFVIEALKRYFQEQADYQIAKDRFCDHTDEIISDKELRNELGL